MTFNNVSEEKWKSMRLLIAHLYLSNKEDFLNNYGNLNDFFNDHCLALDGQTGKPDCFLLYLLGSEFKPKLVFDAGTSTGTSAKFLASGCGRFGGAVYTCDPVDIYLASEKHDEFIKRHTMGALGLIKELSNSNKKVDLSFIDTDLPEKQIDLLLDIAGENSVFVVRDFYDESLQLGRGALNMDFAWKTLGPKGYELFVPDASAYTYGHWHVLLSNGNHIFTGVGGCSAVAVPPSFELSP